MRKVEAISHFIQAAILKSTSRNVAVSTTAATTWNQVKGIRQINTNLRKKIRRASNKPILLITVIVEYKDSSEGKRRHNTSADCRYAINRRNRAAEMAPRPAHAARAISPPKRQKPKPIAITNKLLQWYTPPVLHPSHHERRDEPERQGKTDATNAQKGSVYQPEEKTTP